MIITQELIERWQQEIGAARQLSEDKKERNDSFRTRRTRSKAPIHGGGLAPIRDGPYSRSRAFWGFGKGVAICLDTDI